MAYKMNRAKFFGIIAICCVVGSLVIIYPDQTKDILSSFFCTEDCPPEWAQIWRVRTKHGITNKDIQIDFANATRNGEYLGEAEYYNKGYIEFVLGVAEFDNITLYLEKEGFVPLNASFVVPRIYPIGGQTYYILSDVKLYPIIPTTDGVRTPLALDAKFGIFRDRCGLFFI